MLSDLWLPIAEHIEEINGPMPAMHHYTSLKGALGILSSGRFWFTERAHLNDPTEISHGVKIARDALRQKVGILDTENLSDTADRIFRDFRFFSASFSFAFDDSRLWKYADNGKGVCLSFKATVFNTPKAFVDKFISGNPTAFVCPMSYGSERLRSVIDAIIGHWDGQNIEELANHIFMISGMFKADKWQREKEYRFFVHHRYTKIVSSAYHKEREQGGRIIAYLDLPIQGWNSPDGLPIYRICLGPEAPPDAEDELKALFSTMARTPRDGIRRSAGLSRLSW